MPASSTFSITRDPHHSVTTFRHTWRIENFSFLQEQPGQYVEAKFRPTGDDFLTWIIRLYPRGKAKVKAGSVFCPFGWNLCGHNPGGGTFVDVQVLLADIGKRTNEEWAKLSVEMLDPRDQVIRQHQTSGVVRFISGRRRGVRWDKFVRRDQLLSACGDGDVVTVVCRVHCVVRGDAADSHQRTHSDTSRRGGHVIDCQTGNLVDCQTGNNADTDCQSGDAGSGSASSSGLIDLSNSPKRSQLDVCDTSGDLTLAQDFGSLLSEEPSVYSDVTLRAAGDVQIRAHKVVLCARSAYFRQRLRDGKMADPLVINNDVIDISDIVSDVEVLREVLTFLYTDRSPHISLLSKQLLPASNAFVLPNLKRLCEEQLCSEMSGDTVEEYLRLALDNGADVLKARACEMMRQKVAI